MKPCLASMSELTAWLNNVEPVPCETLNDHLATA